MTPSPSVHQLDYSKFVKFHPSASGKTGRTVYIDPNLITKFLQLIDLSSAQGKLIAQGLIALQATAAGATSDSNRNNAFQHRTTVQNVVATYTVLQSGGRGSGVYITDLHHSYNRDVSRPGLYRAVQDTRDLWKAVEESPSATSMQIGVVGAVPPNENGEVSANSSAIAFAATVLNKERRNIMNGYSLFYTPSYVVDGLGVWITSDQKRSVSSNSPKLLADVLANTVKNQNRLPNQEKRKWYVVGHGASVFQQALQEYNRRRLPSLSDSHQFYFVDPQVPLGSLKEDLRKNGIDLYHDNAVIDSTMSIGSRMHQLADPSQLYCNMHRSWQVEKSVTAKLKLAQKSYKSLGNTGVYFSDIIKQLAEPLAGRWR